VGPHEQADAAFVVGARLGDVAVLARVAPPRVLVRVRVAALLPRVRRLYRARLYLRARGRCSARSQGCACGMHTHAPRHQVQHSHVRCVARRQAQGLCAHTGARRPKAHDEAGGAPVALQMCTTTAILGRRHDTRVQTSRGWLVPATRSRLGKGWASGRPRAISPSMLTGANPRRQADLTLNENMRKLSVCVKSS